MTDLLNRANVNIAMNTLLNDLQPNDAIQPSDHNGLLVNILDTLANGLSTTLRTGNTTGGFAIDITDGDTIKYNKGGSFVGVLDSLTLTGSRSWDFPDKSGTIALLSDITGGDNIASANLTFDGTYYADLSSFSWTLGGTAPIGAEKISLQKDTLIKGSNNAGGTSGFKITNSNNDLLLDVRNDGDVILNGDTIVNGSTPHGAFQVFGQGNDLYLDIRNNGNMGYGGDAVGTVSHLFQNPSDEASILKIQGFNQMDYLEFNSSSQLFLKDNNGLFQEFKADGWGFYASGVRKVFLSKIDNGYYAPDLTIGATTSQTGGSALAVVEGSGAGAVHLKTVSTGSVFTSLKVNGDNRVFTGAPLQAPTTVHQPNSTVTQYISGTDLISVWKDVNGTVKTLNLGTYT